MKRMNRRKIWDEFEKLSKQLLDLRYVVQNEIDFTTDDVKDWTKAKDELIFKIQKLMKETQDYMLGRQWDSMKEGKDETQKIESMNPGSKEGDWGYQNLFQILTKKED